VPENIEAWWSRRQRSKGLPVPYPVGTYRDAWAKFPVLVRQYHPDLNREITLTQIPPAADVYLTWQCDAGHVFVATPDEQRGRPGRVRRRSAWCPVCTELAVPRRAPVPRSPLPSDATVAPAPPAASKLPSSLPPADGSRASLSGARLDAGRRPGADARPRPTQRRARGSADGRPRSRHPSPDPYAGVPESARPAAETDAVTDSDARASARPIAHTDPQASAHPTVDARPGRTGRPFPPASTTPKADARTARGPDTGTARGLGTGTASGATPGPAPGVAFWSARAPKPASAAEADLRQRLGTRLDLDLSLNAVGVSRPFFDRREVWPDIVLAELCVAIEYDTIGRFGLEHVGPREDTDRRKDRLLRAAGWEVVRIRCGKLVPIGPHDLVASGVTDTLIDRILETLREIRGDLFVNAYLR
jgi:hypothetical protein